ncbi:hypothetical protein ES707_20107 [subsurface metagenome]
MGKREGEVKDLAEKLEKGEITKEEVLREMKSRKLRHHAGEPIPGIFGISGMIGWAVLFFLPFISALLDLDVPEVFSIEIPSVVSYLAIFFTIITVPPFFYSVYLREARSVTGDENIILVRTGTYAIVRHSAFVGAMILFFVLPLILALVGFPLTILSVIAYIPLTTGMYLQVLHEEKINLRKWGDEYLQYMKEVPRFNFIKGLWNLRKRR